MSERGYHLFQTAVGPCGIAWGPLGVTAVQLAEQSEEQTRAKLRARSPAAPELEPPAPIGAAVAQLQAMLRGEAHELAGVALDLSGVPEFHRKVYEASRALAPGETVTYGALAQRVGSPGAARAVGQAMARNPFVLVVPCHRVLASGGMGGFSAQGGVVTKARLLEQEGVRVQGSFQPTLTPRLGSPRFDPDGALAELRGADPKLAALIGRVGPFVMPVETPASVYDAIARSIVFQQLATAAATTIWGRVLALSPDGALLAPEALLATADERLRGAGLSQNKLLALRDLAARSLDGSVPTMAEAEAMSDDALVERLSAVRGVGRWTVEMFLMFGLGRPDVLPVGDFGVRNGFRLAYGLREMPTPERLVRQARRWTPWRTIASWYLWRAVDLERALNLEREAP